MSKKANPKLIGGFVLGAIALIVVIIVAFGSGDYFKKLEKYVIYFRGNAGGLKIGAPIKVRGVQIGKVIEIRGITDSFGTFHVEVKIENDPDALDYFHDGDDWLIHAPQEEALKFYVEKGLRAQLATQSIVTGQQYIKLEYFPDSELVFAGWNEKYKDKEIPSVATSGEALQRSLDEVLINLNQIPVQEISISLIQALQSIDTLARTPELRSTLKALTTTLNETKTVLNRLEGHIEPVTTSLVETSKEARDAMKRTEALMQRLDKSVENDRYELQMALRELTKATRAMRNLLDYLERNPASIIHGKK